MRLSSGFAAISKRQIQKENIFICTDSSFIIIVLYLIERFTILAHDKASQDTQPTHSTIPQSGGLEKLNTLAQSVTFPDAIVSHLGRDTDYPEPFCDLPVPSGRC
jgi:hypothetical protein